MNGRLNDFNLQNLQTVDSHYTMCGVRIEFTMLKNFEVKRIHDSISISIIINNVHEGMNINMINMIRINKKSRKR
jgi:hypothetical protein